MKNNRSCYVVMGLVCMAAVSTMKAAERARAFMAPRLAEPRSALSGFYGEPAVQAVTSDATAQNILGVPATFANSSPGWSDKLRFNSNHAWALAALSALSAAGGAYWYYQTAYMDPRIEKLRQAYRDVLQLLEYALLPWDENRQQGWQQYMGAGPEQLNDRLELIEKNLGSLGVRRGAFWGFWSGMSDAASIIDNFKIEMNRQRAAELDAAQNGRPKPLPGQAFRQSVEKLAKLIATALSKEEERSLESIIRAGEFDATVAGAQRTVASMERDRLSLPSPALPPPLPLPMPLPRPALPPPVLPPPILPPPLLSLYPPVPMLSGDESGSVESAGLPRPMLPPPVTARTPTILRARPAHPPAYAPAVVPRVRRPEAQFDRSEG